MSSARRGVPVTLTAPLKVTVAVRTSPVFSRSPRAPTAEATTAVDATGAVASIVTSRTVLNALLPASSVTTARKRQVPSASAVCAAVVSAQAPLSSERWKVTVAPGSWPVTVRLKVLSLLSPSEAESPKSEKLASASVPAAGGVVSTR